MYLMPRCILDVFIAVEEAFEMSKNVFENGICLLGSKPCIVVANIFWGGDRKRLKIVRWELRGGRIRIEKSFF